MIFISIFILLFVILLFRHEKPIEPIKPVDENITEILLSVPYQAAQGKDWCLPASGAMVFKYYGKNITQAQIANRIIIDSFSSTFRLVSYARELGYLAEWKRISIKEIEEYLIKGIPLIIIQKYSLSVKGTHCRVIVGFDSVKSELTLHDSAGQSNYKMGYKAFFDLGFDSSEISQIIIIKEVV